MDAKQVIEIAKAHVSEIFSSDGARNIGLEELYFDDNSHIWSVTVGFTRPWDGPQGVNRFLREGDNVARTFKTVEIDDNDGKILGVRHWPVAA